MRTYAINITLNYKRIPYIKATYINCLVNSLNIYANKTQVFSSDVLFTYPFTSKKLYYNSSLFLNENINLTSIGL